ncbi:MAG: hypothetical protein AB7O67_16915 [Vicinamibacterales bacterium]
MHHTRVSRLVTVGLFLLAVSGIASYLLQRHSTVPESLADPVIGFLYGVSIATTLLGVRAQARKQSARCS